MGNTISVLGGSSKMLLNGGVSSLTGIAHYTYTYTRLIHTVILRTCILTHFFKNSPNLSVNRAQRECSAAYPPTLTPSNFASRLRQLAFSNSPLTSRVCVLT